MLGPFATASRRTPLDVHNNNNNDDNDNAWQRGPLWPHGMDPIKCKKTNDNSQPLSSDLVFFRQYHADESERVQRLVTSRCLL